MRQEMCAYTFTLKPLYHRPPDPVVHSQHSIILRPRISVWVVRRKPWYMQPCAVKEEARQSQRQQSYILQKLLPVAVTAIGCTTLAPPKAHSPRTPRDGVEGGPRDGGSWANSTNAWLRRDRFLHCTPNESPLPKTIRRVPSKIPFGTVSAAQNLIRICCLPAFMTDL